MAHRTQASTTEIQSLVEHFQKNVKSTVDVMQEGSASSLLATEDSSNATQALDEIGKQIYDIFQLNTNIASSSEEQGAIIKNINESIQSINEKAKETATQSNKTSQSSTQIESTASELQSLIATYKF